MIPLSPGAAYGCFNLLRIVAEHRLPLASICQEVPRFERLRTNDLLDIALRVGWIRQSDSGLAVLSAAGDSLMAIKAESFRLRRALVDYIEVDKPGWVALVLDGRSRVMKFAPVEFRQTIMEAYLAEGYSADVVDFWDMLAALARGERQIVLSRIGRFGERLTLAYEKARTGQEPQWRSIESNLEGYDVLSIVSAQNAAKMPIEVKTSTQGLAGVFYLTRNEWEETALLPNHSFHLWSVPAGKAPRLATLNREDVAPHVPSNNGAGAWKEAEIPFSAFAAKFASVPIALAATMPDDSELDNIG